MPDVHVLRGVKAFNAGRFFLAHEIWEDVWRDSLPPAKDYYQALIQAAIAFYHLQRGNFVGARRLADRALGRLEHFDPQYLGLDTRRLRLCLEQVLTGDLTGKKDQINDQTCPSCVPDRSHLPVFIGILDDTIGKLD